MKVKGNREALELRDMGYNGERRQWGTKVKGHWGDKGDRVDYGEIKGSQERGTRETGGKSRKTEKTRETIEIVEPREIGKSWEIRHTGETRETVLKLHTSSM